MVPVRHVCGVLFDVELSMGPAFAILSRKAGWRLKSILRPLRFFTEQEIVNLYKTRVLSYMESGTPAYAHAARSVLDPLDRVQCVFSENLVSAPRPRWISTT